MTNINLPLVKPHMTREYTDADAQRDADQLVLEQALREQAEEIFEVLNDFIIADHLDTLHIDALRASYLGGK
jgi:hypothetical protein